ncbi:hypothetical protein V8E52_011635 [Russula decolorans]
MVMDQRWRSYSTPRLFSISEHGTATSPWIRAGPREIMYTCQLRPSGLLVLLPLLIVFSTFLSLLLLFLICILLLRRRRGIALHDNDGPIDMSRDDLSRWLESVNDTMRRLYLRAKASSFDPGHEMISSLPVADRAYLSPRPSSATSSKSLPENTTVALPHFRLPGHCRYSIAYHSNGGKTYNYPFTATPLAPSLKKGDVVGYAFVGFLSFNNLFPTIRADGPCSLDVDLGQGSFVFIEANALAPPPAYGSGRGSILLEPGAGVSPPSIESSPSVSSRRLHRGYISPTDLSFHTLPNSHIPASPPSSEGTFSDDSHHLPHSRSQSHGQAQARCHHWHRADPRVGSDAGISWIDPPAYSSLDAYTYRDGVHPDLPAEVLAAALEHGTIPATAIATNRSRRSRKRRETGS